MNKKQAITILKILLGLAFFALLWIRLKDQFTPEKWENLKLTLGNSTSVLYLVLVTIMVTPNWMTEAFKWKLITKDIEEISYMQALKGVLAGVCVGNLTPGRFGEFAGRILYFTPHNRAKITVTHFVCGVTQLFATLVFGLLAGVLWLLGSGEITTAYIGIISVCVALLFFLLIVLLKADTLYSWMSKRRILQRFNLGTVSYPKKVLVKLLVLSSFRYLIFSYQYVLLLQCCGSPASYAELIIPVAIYFMLLSSLPMISFIEVAVRVGVSVVLFAPYNANELLIVIASILLWFVNLVIPSIVGYFIILGTKIKLSELKPGASA